MGPNRTASLNPVEWAPPPPYSVFCIFIRGIFFLLQCVLGVSRLLSWIPVYWTLHYYFIRDIHSSCLICATENNLKTGGLFFAAAATCEKGGGLCQDMYTWTLAFLRERQRGQASRRDSHSLQRQRCRQGRRRIETSLHLQILQVRCSRSSRFSLKIRACASSMSPWWDDAASSASLSPHPSLLCSRLNATACCACWRFDLRAVAIAS